MSFCRGKKEAKSFILSGTFRDLPKMAQKGKVGAKVSVVGDTGQEVKPGQSLPNL